MMTAVIVLLLIHVGAGFALGRLGSVRAFIIEAGLIFGLGLLASFGLFPGLEQRRAEDWVGLYGVMGAVLPLIAAAYALGVTLRWPLRLPRTGLLWRVTRPHP